MIRSTREQSDATHDHPRPILAKMRWPYPLIWLVPVLAVLLAVSYFLDESKNRGAEIAISFKDTNGLKGSNSTIAHLGVDIGKITGIALTEDQQQVDVSVRLKKSADAFARKGAIFWIVRPEISAESISGLSTITSGPYIEAVPGAGDWTTEFTGLESAPNSLGEGLLIVLHAPRLEHVQPDSAVYFRGIQVGVVKSINLSDNANGIEVRAFIWQRYSRLVRADSMFWIVSGANVNGGIFTGVHVKLESLRTLISGGVAFATPDTPPQDSNGEPVKPGSQFPLYDEPQKDWLNWSPRIPLPPGDAEGDQRELNLPQSNDNMRTAIKGK